MSASEHKRKIFCFRVDRELTLLDSHNRRNVFVEHEYWSGAPPAAPAVEIFRAARKRKADDDATHDRIDGVRLFVTISDDSGVSVLSRFSVEVYDDYPFSRPLIGCLEFAGRTDMADAVVGMPANAVTDDILAPSWTPGINLNDIISRIEQFTHARISSGVEEAECGKSHTGLVFGILEAFDRRNARAMCLALMLVLSIVIRLGLGFFPHSGEGQPPIYGDYEAHRHWMEVTRHLPMGDWYINTAANDLSYWGLDYPPLAAYHARAFGHLSAAIHSEESVALQLSSRGFQTPGHRTFMRCTVILTELVFLFPAAWHYWFRVRRALPWTSRAACFFLFVNNPVLLLIDHGHFQYNCLALGLLVWFVIFISGNAPLTAVAFFVAAVCAKHTSLYFLPAATAVVAARCIFDLERDGNFRVRWKLPSAWQFIRRMSLLSGACLLVAGAAFYPIVASFGAQGTASAEFAAKFRPQSALEAVLQKSGLIAVVPVLQRLFPFERGLYEDYVANFWVAISPILKAKAYAHASSTSRQLVTIVSATVTFFTSCRSCGGIFSSGGSVQRICAAMYGSALSFFIFSFLVHEKGILLPLTFLLMILPEWGPMSILGCMVSWYSLFPLMVKDHLIAPWIVVGMGWGSIAVDGSRGICGWTFARPSWKELVDDIWRLGTVSVDIQEWAAALGQAPTERARQAAVALRGTPRSRLHFYAFVSLALGGAAWLLAKAVVEPPPMYPWLLELIHSIMCCGVLMALLMLIPSQSRRLPSGH